MFQNRYDSELFKTPIAGRPSVRINGVPLEAYGFMLTEMPNLFLPPIRERLITLDNQSGSLDMGAVYDNWSFTMTGVLMGLTHEDLVKKSAILRRWLDIQQHRQSEFLINQTSVRGIMFELSGQTLWYSDGTVTTDGTQLITGSGTRFLSYIKPGSRFEVEGDTTQYGVQNVQSDTILYLTANIARANASGLKYRVERKKFLIVNYNGESTVSSFAPQGFLSQSKIGSAYTTQASNIMNITLGFRTPYPAWVGDWFEYVGTSIVSSTFTEVNGIGTGMVIPRIQVRGAANTPKIVEATYGFLCNFNGTLDGTDVQKNTVTGSYTVGGPGTYQDVNRGLGAYVELASPDTLFFDNVLVNKDQFSFVCRFRPQTASASMGANGYVFDLISNTTTKANGFSVRFDFANDTWSFERLKTSTPVVITTANNVARFNADEEIEVSGSFNSSGMVDPKDGITYYMKLLFNGEVVATQTTATTAPDVNLVDLFVGSKYLSVGAPTGDTQFNAVFSELAFFNVSLSDEELRSIFTHQEYLVNTNSVVNIGFNLAANDVADLDPSFNHRLYDVSDNLVSNAATSITGYPLVIRGTERERCVLFFTTSSGTIGTFKAGYRPIFR